MTARVRSRIQRLMQDLDHEDSFEALEPSSAALAAATTSGATPVDEFKHLLMTTPSTSTSVSRSDVDYSDTTTDTGLIRRHRPTQPDHHHGQRGGGGRSPSRDQHAYLEAKVLQLMSENKALQLSAEREAARRAMEVTELQGQLAGAVRQLAQRQQEVEAAAPLLRLKAEDFREKLKDLRISSAQYAELQSMPREGLHMLDDVKLAVFEATDELRQDNERLRLAAAAAAEAAARSQEAAGRAHTEGRRMAAALAERERDLELVTEGFRTRVERLASELEASHMRAEVLTAKGKMYDELRASADRLVEENQRLLVVEATFKRLEVQSHDLQLRDAARGASHEMLAMDKAYLSKQAEFLAEQQRKGEQELEQRDRKINELQASRQELYDRLMQTQTLKDKEGDARMQRELAQLQASTHADIERIRVEMSEAYEREARLLRELRDQALDDASRTKASFTELQQTHEKSTLYNAELQRRLESQVVELQTELKQRSFELAHFKVVLSEKENLLSRGGMQIDMLQDKVQVLMDRYRTLEADYRMNVVQAGQRQEQAAAAAVAAAVAAEGAAAGEAATGSLTAVATSSRLVGQRPVAVTVQQEVQRVLLGQERDALADKVMGLQSELRITKEMVALAGQPHSFLVQELQGAKLQLHDATSRCGALQAALAAKDDALGAAEEEREALRRDLDAVLTHRGQLDGMKQAVLRALGGTGATAAAGGTLLGDRAGASPAQPQRQQATVIVGEGPS